MTCCLDDDDDDDGDVDIDVDENARQWNEQPVKPSDNSSLQKEASQHILMMMMRRRRRIRMTETMMRTTMAIIQATAASKSWPGNQSHDQTAMQCVIFTSVIHMIHHFPWKAILFCIAGHGWHP